jgi:formylglycine-generating enzyme required for sulfatase activity/tRNA A-37 threonylcarbamoyl transferase component Bud32
MNITGTQIKNLKILSEIGEGGMGVVFLATHVILEKKFAVKCLTPELSTSLQFRERFEKEAMAQAALNHPNVVQVNDFFEHNDRYYLVMEYVDGHSLADMIDHGGKLSEQNALPILKDILAGVNFAHSRGIIHRDIKPSNILIDKSGRAKIMDFGIAIRAGDDHRLTKTGVDIGTAWYVSPEQVVNPKGVDHRSDVYSIGVVLFEMLTGRTPFDGETDYTIKDKHVRETPPGVSEINPDVSDELSGIVMKALEKSPDDRFNGCGDFLEYVEAYDHQLNGLESTGVSIVSEDAGTTGTYVPLEPPEPTFEDPITGMQFVYVHGGEFIMGETFEGESSRETQTQEVGLDGFYMGRNPVTCGQWKHLMGVDPSAFSAGDSYPVEMVSWENAQEFIENLTAENNRKYLFRLPTEAEWEYTARSGGKAEKYSGSDAIDTVAWYDRNSDNGTRPVGGKASNGLGIHDMSGNVWEWCGDWFGDYRSNGDKNPTGPPVGAQRVLRGGSWSSDISQCQSTCRYHNWPEYKDGSWGLRLVRGMMPPEPLSSLSVASSPKGASIWIGGRDTGEKTDTLIELPPGKYKVGLTIDGYKATTQEVEIVSGSPAEVEFRLKKIPASLPFKRKKHTRALIASAIAAALCFLCVLVALVLYSTDPGKDLLDPAEKANKTRNVSKPVASSPQSQEANKPDKISSPQNASKSALFVDAEPEDAHVQLLDFPKIFHQGMALEPGRYHLEVSRKGCKTKKVWVDLETGKRKSIRIQLQWVISQLFIETAPKDSQVRLLNAEKEFRQGMILEPKRYDVEISHDGYKTQKIWVDLTPGQKNTFRIQLELVTSQLKVKCEPKDAKIRLLNIKQKFHQEMALKPGRYHLAVSHESYKTQEVWVTLSPEERKTLQITLEKNVVETSPKSGKEKDTAPAESPSSFKMASEDSPTDHFLYDNGTIWDTRTGLEWIVGPDEGTSFLEATKWLEKRNGKYRFSRQWRLPTDNEMQTICNRRKSLPAFFKTSGLYVWCYKRPSATEVWIYDLKNGTARLHNYISVSVERVFGVRSRKD